MNINDPNQRARGLLTGPLNGSFSSRTAQDARAVHPQSAATGNSETMTRAEQFDSEKRRIIDSCFSKKDADGIALENYITHMRIIEDAAFPSTPPPPNSPAENKKYRVIIVAVRKSGRVRMHKARENANGLFSIGKSWVLDDLTVIRNFSGVTPTSPEEQQHAQWAGDTGFIVTIQKSYYWQANTLKEKDFFIASIVKIYKKYTAGKNPQLYGFTVHELETLMGGMSAQPKTPQTAAGRMENGGSVQAPPIPRAARTPVTLLTSAGNDNGGEIRARLPQDRSTSGTPTEERGPSLPGQFPSSDFVRNLRSPNPKSQLRDNLAESPVDPNFVGNDLDHLAHPSSYSREETDACKVTGAQSIESFRSGQDSQAGSVPSASYARSERSRPSAEYAAGNNNHVPAALRIGTSRSGTPTAPQFPQEQLPERRRPPMSGGKPSSNQMEHEGNSLNGFNTPSTTAGSGSDAFRIPVRSPSRTEHNTIESLSIDRRIPSNGVSSKPSTSTREVFQEDHSTSSQEVMVDPRKADIDASEASISSETVGPRSSIEHSAGANQSEMYRPGLGPMIKSRQISTDGTPNVSKTNNHDSSPARTSHTTNDTPPPESPVETKQEITHRPGLGPMIKKKSNKDIANTFRKAATAYGAFKPRPGGALEKLLDEKTKTAGGPNGITGVVPAPSLSRNIHLDGTKSPLEAQVIPSLQITTPPASRDGPVDVDPAPSASAAAHNASETPASATEEQVRKPHTDRSIKYANALGIDPSFLEGRTTKIESILDDFGWSDENNHLKSFEDLQSDIRKEIARVEAGSWLGAIEHNDSRIAAVGNMMDRVIAECEELDGLLTLYNVELGTLSEDVAYIEAQSQGLQVQTANQKLLHAELKNLLDTISISASELQILKEASLTKSQGLQAIESTLNQLFTAMLTIDPKMHGSHSRPATAEKLSADRSSTNVFAGSQVSNMRAVREKKEVYLRESSQFLQRLKQYMSIKFRETESQIVSALDKAKKSKPTNSSTSLDPQIREMSRQDLWVYSPVLLFTRVVDLFEWEDLMRMYEPTAKKPYQDEFTDIILGWQRLVRKPAGDEQDALFTTHEKEHEGSVGRKLTVKRSKTVRADGTNRPSYGDRIQDGKMMAHEAFAGALNETTQVIYTEQNFVVDLFHMSSLENADFSDAIAVPLDSRTGRDLSEKKLFDPDRNMARRVVAMMEEIFSFWTGELQTLADWVIKHDALQGIGILFALEDRLSALEDSNQEFLIQVLSRVHDRLATIFGRFIEEQIRGIEDTKVKIKKRTGVIAFIRTFPNFSYAVESMLIPPPTTFTPPIRLLVNDAYQQINKAMFESLKFIAKELPPVMAGQNSTQAQASGDPEDKEALNYHILIIENMNHYIEEVNTRNNNVLEEWKTRATHEMAEHMDLYLSSVIRRPLGKLLDFMESTESLMLIMQTTAIATRASHSRSTFKKLLSTYDAKEIKRGIDTLKKRVEKHFGDADDLGISRGGLVPKVLKECEIRYHDVGERAMRIAREVYEGGLEVEWRKEDVAGAFRR